MHDSAFWAFSFLLILERNASVQYVASSLYENVKSTPKHQNARKDLCKTNWVLNITYCYLFCTNIKDGGNNLNYDKKIIIFSNLKSRLPLKWIKKHWKYWLWTCLFFLYLQQDSPEIVLRLKKFIWKQWNFIIIEFILYLWYFHSWDISYISLR